MSVLIKYRIITKHTDIYLIIYPHQSSAIPNPPTPWLTAYRPPISSACRLPLHFLLTPLLFPIKNKEDGSQRMPVRPLVSWLTKCSGVCLINAWVIKRLVMDTSKNIFNVIQFNRVFYHIDPSRDCLKSEFY